MQSAINDSDNTLSRIQPWNVSLIFLTILRRLFKRIGYSVGNHPWIYLLIVSLLCLCMTLGCLNISFSKDPLRNGYTAINARCIQEQKIFEEFYRQTGVPSSRFIFVEGADKQSLLEGNSLEAVANLTELLITKTIPIRDQNFTFLDVCYPHCEAVQIVQKFYEAYQYQLRRLASNQSTSSHFKLDYPFTKLFTHEIKLSPYFYDVEVANFSEREWKRQPTSISHLGLIVLVFYSNNPLAEEFFKEWDKFVFKIIMDFKDHYIAIGNLDDYLVWQEILRSVFMAIPYYGAGIVLMMLFAVVTVGLSAVLSPQVGLRYAKPFVTLMAVVTPILATTSALGILFLLGFAFDSLLVVVPFLILAIGIDDGFLMIHGWQRKPKHQPVAERMAELLEELGPSIAATSVTNVLAFAVGAANPTPSVRTACVAASLGMALDFLCQVTIFGAILALSERNLEHSKSKPQVHELQVHSLVSKALPVLKAYCRFVVCGFAQIVLCFSLAAYWTAAVIGVISAQPELSINKTYLSDSIIHESNRIASRVWYQNFPVTLTVNKPPDFSNKEELERFQSFLREMETSPNSNGPEWTEIFLKDFETYTYSAVNYYDNPPDYEDYSTLETDLSTFHYWLLPKFLLDLDYAHWSSSVQLFNDSGTVNIKAFQFIVSFRNSDTTIKKKEVYEQVRIIADKFSEFNVSVWQRENYIFDQLATLRSNAFLTLGITLASMSLVCFWFIPSLCCVLVATIAIASVSTGVFGFLNFWGVDLDPMSVSALIMAIGFSVDFTAHIVYHYYRVCCEDYLQLKSKKDLLFETFCGIGWPMIQAGLSTVLCLVLLGCVDAYIPHIFLKTAVLVVSLGLVHALFVLPVILSALSHRLIVQGAGNNLHNKERNSSLGSSRTSSQCISCIQQYSSISYRNDPTVATVDFLYSSDIGTPRKIRPFTVEPLGRNGNAAFSRSKIGPTNSLYIETRAPSPPVFNTI